MVFTLSAKSFLIYLSYIMEKVLKKILREFYQSKWISVEVIGNLSDNQSSYLIENVYKKKIKLDYETKQKINSYFSSLKEKLSRINPFSGSFVDKYTGEENSVEFNLIPTHHYAERLFRKEDPKYKTDERVINPMEYEGIDLLVYNRDRLAQEILTKRIKHNDLVKVTTKDGSNYQMLVNFNNSGKKGSPQSYNLLLVNQMKGKGLNFYTNDKELKLNSPR